MAFPQAPTTGSKRGLSLRENMIARVLKKIGATSAELTDKQLSFVHANTDNLIMSGSVGVRDVADLAHRFRAVFPEFQKPTKPAAATARDGGRRTGRATKKVEVTEGGLSNTSPVGDRYSGPTRGEGKASKSPPPAYTPAPPGSQLHHRKSAVAREARLVRDAAWAAQVDAEARLAQEAKVREREAAAKKRAEQRATLERQVEEQRRKKQSRQEELREHSQTVIAQTQKELDDERREREAQKRKMFAEREVRERTLTDHLESRRRKHEQQRDEERRYLREIQAEEQDKKATELRRRGEARAQFKAFLDENRAFEASKRERESVQQDRERREMEEARKVQLEREDRAKLELRRKSVRGELQQRKQDRILSEFERQRLDAEAEQMREAERIARVQQQREQREQEDEAARRKRKDELKSQFTHALDEQLEEKRMATTKTQAQRQEGERVIFGESSGLSAKSDMYHKQKEAERKRQLQIVLEAQMRDKELRDRMDIQTKIR